MIVKFRKKHHDRIDVISVRDKNFHKTIGELVYFQNGDLSYEWVFDGIAVIHQDVMEEILLKLKELNS